MLKHRFEAKLGGLDKSCVICYNTYIMETQIDFADLINLTQAAKYLGKSYMTIYRWRKSGKLKVTYIGGLPYVSLGELIRLKEGI